MSNRFASVHEMKGAPVSAGRDLGPRLGTCDYCGGSVWQDQGAVRVLDRIWHWDCYREDADESAPTRPPQQESEGE